MLSRPEHPDAAGDRLGGLPDPADLGGAEGDRRQRARGVAGVDAGLLDVLHHAAEVELLAVEQRVHVDLDRVVDEPVDQHRVLRADRGGPLDVALQRVVVVHDLHAAPAQHVRRPHQHRVADLGGDLAAPRRTTTPCRAWARAAPPRAAPGRRRPAPRPGGSPRAWCRRSARRRRPAPARARAGSGRPSWQITPAIGPACGSACTISSTSSSVSGSKYSRSEVS